MIENYRASVRCGNCRRTNNFWAPKGITKKDYLLSKNSKCGYCGCPVITRRRK